MRIVLHVGMHKTGTSAIQAVLEENRKVLSDKGWKYSFLPNEFPSLFKCLKGRHADSSEIESEVRSFFIDEEHENFIVSHESMTASFQSDSAWERKAKIIKDAFSVIGDVDVILYYRRQDDYYESAFQQRVKGGTSSSKNLALTIKEFPPLENLNWNEKIEKYLTIIEPNNRYLVSYDIDKADLLPRFFDYLSIDQKDIKMPESGVRVNTASFYSSMYFSLYGGVGEVKDNKGFVKKLSHLDEKLGDTKDYKLLDKEIRKDIFDKYYQSNIALLKRSINGNQRMLEKWNSDIESQVDIKRKEEFLIKGLVEYILLEKVSEA